IRRARWPGESADRKFSRRHRCAPRRDAPGHPRAACGSASCPCDILRRRDRRAPGAPGRIHRGRESNPRSGVRRRGAPHHGGHARPSYDSFRNRPGGGPVSEGDLLFPRGAWRPARRALTPHPARNHPAEDRPPRTTARWRAAHRCRTKRFFLPRAWAPPLLLTPIQSFAECAGDKCHRSYGALVVHTHRAQHADRALRLVLERIRGADQGKVLARWIDPFHTDLNMHRIWRVNAAGQKGDELVLFLNRGQNFPRLGLIGKFRGRRHLRGPFHVNPLRRALPQHSRVAQRQGIADQKIIAFLLHRQAGKEIGPNGFERASDVMAVQIISRAVQIRLGVGPLRPNDLVSVAPPVETKTITTRPSGNRTKRMCSRTVLAIGGETIIPRPREISARTCPARSVTSSVVVADASSPRIQRWSSGLNVACAATCCAKKRYPDAVGTLPAEVCGW